MRSTRLPTILGSLSAFLAIDPSLSQAQQVPSSLSPGLPNQKLNVQRQSETCPQTVGLWTILVGSEGGADLTLVADTRSLAGSAKVVSSSKKSVEYEAPLHRAYASCGLFAPIAFAFAMAKFIFG